MSLEERFLMMTGNNKVWRAPVAGLASVAMLATMGVAAMTANAAQTVFTFEGEGLTFDGKTSYQVTSADDVLDANEIAQADAAIDQNYAHEWYTTDAYGQANTAVQAGKTKDKTVYAHWSNDSTYTVYFDGSYATTLYGQNGVYDVLSDWQVPGDATGTTEVPAKVLDGYKTAAGNVIDPAGIDLTPYAAMVEGTNTYAVDLTANNVPAYRVTFNTKDFAGKDWTPAADAKLVVDVKQGSPFSDYGVLPELTRDERKVETWKVKQDDAAFDPNAAVTSDLNLTPASSDAYYTVTFVVDGKNYAVKTVADGTAAASVKPADPTKAASDKFQYKFAGWKTAAGKDFDFNTNITGDVTLTAAFEVSAVKFTYNVDKGQQLPIEQWVTDGMSYVAPTLNDESFTGWSPVVAEGTKLYIKQAGESSYVYYLRAAGDENNTITAPTTYYATYEYVDPDTLAEYEEKVSVDMDADEQKLYTADSYREYVSEFQEYLAKKEDLHQGGYTKAEYAELIQDLKDMQAKLVEVGHTNLYRVYNPNNGDHYFTIDKNEASHLVNLGWNAEGAPYKVISNNGRRTAFGTAIWSVYNPNTGEHLLTEEGEADALAQVGWTKEDVKFYTVQNGSASVVRVYNPNTNGPAHLYTDASEANGLAKIGWSIDNGGAPVFTLD